MISLLIHQSAKIAKNTNGMAVETETKSKNLKRF